MDSTQNQLDFKIDTPTDKKLREIFENEPCQDNLYDEQINKGTSTPKQVPTRATRKSKRKDQRKARRITA